LNFGFRSALTIIEIFAIDHFLLQDPSALRASG
jgi:hypothetical protein